jgi:hypothetical protein
MPSSPSVVDCIALLGVARVYTADLRCRLAHREVRWAFLVRAQTRFEHESSSATEPGGVQNEKFLMVSDGPWL